MGHGRHGSPWVLSQVRVAPSARRENAISRRKIRVICRFRRPAGSPAQRLPEVDPSFSPCQKIASRMPSHGVFMAFLAVHPLCTCSARAVQVQCTALFPKATSERFGHGLGAPSWGAAMRTVLHGDGHGEEWLAHGRSRHHRTSADQAATRSATWPGRDSARRLAVAVTARASTVMTRLRAPTRRNGVWERKNAICKEEQANSS